MLTAVPAPSPRLSFVIGLCAGLMVGGFATAYLAIHYFPYAVFMQAIKAGVVPELPH